MKKITGLRRARVLKGMSQSELAGKVGVSQPIISLIETGYRKATPDEMARLAKELQADPKMLFPEGE